MEQHFQTQLFSQELLFKFAMDPFKGDHLNHENHLRFH